MQGFLTFSGSDSIHLLQLPRARFTFGADAGRELTIQLPGLPGYCGSFTWNEGMGSWSLEVDLAARSRVQIDDAPVREQSLVLEDGALISVDAVSLRFDLVPESVVFNGAQVRSLPLVTSPLRIGRGNDEADATKIVLDAEDGATSRLHAIIEREGDAWRVVDKSKEGTLRNGRLMVSERLVIGDRLRFGHYTFEFTGRSLRRMPTMSGGRLSASALTRVVPAKAGPKKILNEVSLDVPAGSFIGILGCSGQGKSTLMTALCGLNPATSGTVFFDGRELERGAGGVHRVGFVPQDDIVHTDLTVRQAITFSALLRLPEDPPANEINALVLEMARRLSLEPHLDKRITQLSGGQRKRVSIATELLSKPSMLFLDEPSSGLDPATEFYLMSMLRELAGADCTVLCTTHVLGRAYLFDRIMFVHDGRLVFYGPDTDALQFFQKPSLDEVYLELDKSQSKDGKPPEGRPALDWENDFKASPFCPAAAPLIPVMHDQGAAPPARRPTWRRTLATLLARQWSVLRSDPLNVGFLLMQAIAIAFLIGWVASESGLRAFLSVVAVLWFGTSNAAQQIVSETAIFRRERVCGMGLHVYLQSKILFVLLVTTLQALILFGLVHATALAIHGKADDWKAVRETLEVDPRIAGENDDAGTEDNPGSGATTLGRLFGFKDEEAGRIAALFAIGKDADGGVILDERTIRVRAKERARQMAHDGMALKSDEARYAITSEFKPAAVTRVAAPPPAWKPSKGWQALILGGIRLFDLWENVLNSKQRPMHNEEETVRDVIGDPIMIEAKPLVEVVLLPILLKLLALVAAGATGVALGLAISALVRAPTQAVMWVPLLLIPQILLGGYVVTRPEMGGVARMVSTFVPSAAAERISEVAAIYGRNVPPLSNRTRIPAFLSTTREVVEWKDTDGQGNVTEQSEEYPAASPANTAFQNLLAIPSFLGQRKIQEKADNAFIDSVKERRDVKAGMSYAATSLAPAWSALLVLAGWAMASYIIAIEALRRKQPL